MKEGWVDIELENFCNVNMGQSPPSSTYNQEAIGLPFFQGKAEFSETHPIVRKWCSEPKKTASINDVLLSVRAPVGATNIADQECAIGRGLAALTYKKCYLYLYYYLNFIEHNLDDLGTGTTFRAISGVVLKSQLIPVAPLPEQRTIVAKIEQLFSELDNGIANLKTAQDKLEIYRQAVLKKAFEGELTKKWRALRLRSGSLDRSSSLSGVEGYGTQEQDTLPTAEALLEQIKQERQRHYEQQLVEWENAIKAWEDKGKEGKKSAKPKKLKDYTCNLDNVFEIPNSWIICEQGMVIEEPKYGTSKKCSYEIANKGVLRIPNIQEGRIDSSDIKYAEFTPQEIFT